MSSNVALFLFTAVLARSNALEVCGNYCGPAWCNGKNVNEEYCDDSSPPTSPADNCCRLHDICCGHQKDTSPCNKLIVECLSKLDKADVTCTRPALFPFAPEIPVVPPIIEQTMNIVQDWCCSKPCKDVHKDDDADDVAVAQTGLSAIEKDAAQNDARGEELTASSDPRVGMLVVACVSAILVLVVAGIVRQKQRHPVDYISMDFIEQ